MDCKVSCHVFNTSSFHRGAEISFEISSSSLALPSTQLKLWSSLTSPNKFHQIQTLGTEIQEITFPKCRNCQRQILFPSTFPLSFPFISFKITFTFTWKSSFDFNVAEFAPWQLLLPPRFSQIALRTSWLPSDFLHSVSQFFCKESFEFMLELSFSKIASRISSLPVQIFLQGCFDLV